jgi:polysaccharide deacetylase 2 family uncharacterized protein YibQ
LFERQNLQDLFAKTGPADSIASQKIPLKNNTRQKVLPIITALYKKLGELEAKPSDIMHVSGANAADFALDRLVQISAKIPRGRPIELVVWDLAQSAKEASYRLSDCMSDEKKQSCLLTFDPERAQGPRISLSVFRSEKYFSSTARLAVVGEIDGDTSYQSIVSFLSIQEPLTISLVPIKKRSALTAQLAEQYHKEVVIRLPLEPMGKIPDDFAGKVILVHFSKEIIQSVLADAQKMIPNFSGFENLWGSRALEDSRVMGIIAENIKKTHGYFIESRTTKNSVLPRLSETLGFPLREIGSSIAETTKQAAVEKQLYLCAATAQANGSMIVSIPINPQSVAALKASIPWLKQNGIRLAAVSEIALNKEK